MKKWLNDEREALIIELYEKYENAREVANELGVCTETVYRALRKHGIKRTHRHDDEKKPKTNVSHCRSKYCPALVVMLHMQLGYSVREIADTTGYGQNGVRSVLVKHGVFEVKPKVRKDDFDLDAIEREYLSGVSGREIAKRIGVNQSTVSKWMYGRGIRLGKGAHQSHYGKGGTVKKTCKYCGVTFYTNRVGTKYCSISCASRSHGLRNTSHRMRANLYNVTYDESINIKRLYERDGGICQICGGQCDWNDKSYGNCGPNYPSIDHIVPFASGGEHIWENVQLAHFRCNSIKGARKNKHAVQEAMRNAS